MMVALLQLVGHGELLQYSIINEYCRMNYYNTQFIITDYKRIRELLQYSIINENCHNA